MPGNARVIAPVPQTYAGVSFRSTLEADWAATLDHADLAWSYEPEAVQLPSGTLYRPDFWLPELECWMEVKGPGIPGKEKAYELGMAGPFPVVIGRVPHRGLVDYGWTDGPGLFREEDEFYFPDLLKSRLGYPASWSDLWALERGLGDHRPFARAPRRSA